MEPIADGLFGRDVLSSMCAAALPQRNPMGRQSSSRSLQSLLQYQATGLAPSVEVTYKSEEPATNPTRWNSKAWGAYEYRARVPRLHQLDRSRSTRAARSSTDTGHLNTPPDLITLGPSQTGGQRNHNLSKRIGAGKNDGQDDGCDEASAKGNVGGRKSKEVKAGKETKITLGKVGDKARDPAWLAKVRKCFVGKFYSASTLATKNTKRKKILEILANVGGEPFPITPDKLTTLAAVLVSTGMKAGDQYLGEAKSLHIEGGFHWDQLLERQLATCRRAMQRDKGPEVRAQEVKLSEIKEEQWKAMSNKKNEPRRPTWSYAWATVWMLRAVEAAQVLARHVIVAVDQKQVKLFIAKSKTDQRGAGVWRTLACCGKTTCDLDCPFGLAVKALNDLTTMDGSGPLFPDSEGKHVSKVHMVASWNAWIDERITGHSARRTGAMQYARAGVGVHQIQFLGRWRSSAIFRYIEEAMTEMPMNTGIRQPGGSLEIEIQEDVQNKRALRPKSKPRVPSPSSSPQKPDNKPLVNDETKVDTFVVSNTRGSMTKHLIGEDLGTLGSTGTSLTPEEWEEAFRQSLLEAELEYEMLHTEACLREEFFYMDLLNIDREREEAFAAGLFQIQNDEDEDEDDTQFDFMVWLGELLFPESCFTREKTEKAKF
eukprot:s637_g47.t1